MYTPIAEYNMGQCILINKDSITDGYSMNKKSSLSHRPININPFSIKLPLSALTSIAHRLSGLFLFLMLPFLLWALQILTETPNGYEQLAEIMSPVACKLTAWLLLVAMGYHLVAGLRHILMDMQWLPENLTSAKISAWVVWGATILWIVWLGLRLFGGAQ